MKKLIILILLALSSITYGQLSQINVGTSANDGTGESLRSAFQKVNLGITQINTNTGNIALKLAITDTTNMLLRYINKADTAAMLSKYLRIADTVGIGGGAASYDSTYIHYRVDSIVTVLSDTILGSSVFMELADIKPYYTFGAGTGADADSTLFAKGNKSFGSFRIIEDSLYVESLTGIYMTTGDSLKFNVYYGNGMTRTATDSLFTAPQGAGAYASQTFTPNNKRTINHGHDVWVGIIGPQPANMRPKEWILQLNAKIVRD
jgi:hypothetical protein